MTLYGLPVLFALFVWYFSTGLVLFLDNLPQRTFRWSMLAATALLGGALYGLAADCDDASLTGAYRAFTCAVVAWAWIELSFYTGLVTGPRTERCRDGCAGWRHFGHALQASLYHEVAILALVGVVGGLTWHGANRIGLWTLVVLWWMHESARLNVLLGVRNLNEEFVPEHLAFLRGFLTRKPMNLLFPVSVTVSTIAAVLLVQRATASGASDFVAGGITLLATMMVLAILEHWFLVVPLPTAVLWRWSLGSRAPDRAAERTDIPVQLSATTP